MLFLFSITWGSVSGWWVPVCLLTGLLYAWLFYRKPANLGNAYRYGLFVIRALAVFFLALLLISPLIKSVSYNPQKPLVLILQDNSESIKMFGRTSVKPLQQGEGSKNKVSATVGDLEGASGLAKIKKQLGNDYNVQEFHFSRDLGEGLTTTYNGKQTDISKALRQLNDRFVNQNIGAIVLATDGLYNQGADPQYEAKNFKATFYTVAMGDTVARRDLLIGNINYNKTVFLGNDFEIEVLAEAYQSKGETIRLTVTEDGREVSSQNIPVGSSSFQKQFSIKLNADKKGLRKFNISIAPVKNEISTQNNRETFYIDVLDAKQKVLLLYEGVHPDIGVIRQAIESNKNYELKTSLVTELPTLKAADYNAVILYQLTEASNAAIRGILKNKTPLWYFTGAQTDLQNFNSGQNLIRVSSGRQEMQEVFADPENEFTAFTLSDSAKRKISALPPLLAPYGSYTSPPANGILFKQRIGNVATSYPLLSFNDEGGQRIAILTGEGLWRWQLAEFETYGNHHAVDELFTQGIQYLTANAARQRFSVYTSKPVFDEGENVIVNAELYNDALELINTPDVKIELKNVAGKAYSFLFSRNGQSYQLNAGTLPVGEYSYMAITKNGAKEFKAGGQLTVNPLNLESRQSAANHQLLNTIATQSGGQMVQPSQVNRIADLIRKNENIKTVVYEDKHYNEVIDLKWIFVLIVLLLSVEWFLRKREGEI